MFKSKGIIALIALCFTACNTAENIGSLNTIHSDIQQAYPTISHISAAELESLLAADTPNLLILDTRPEAEYNVSHIKGAVQVNPDMTPQSFKARFGDIAADKTVVIYCSVGWRSTAAAHRLTEAIIAAGGKTVSNLEGGLFGWHNDGRRVVNDFGPTPLIHPYNDKWGALVSREQTLSYTPAQP